MPFHELFFIRIIEFESLYKGFFKIAYYTQFLFNIKGAMICLLNRLALNNHFEIVLWKFPIYSG